MSRRILVDADACPVKDEIYKVAWRHGVAVTIVANSHFRVPAHPLVSRVVVSDGFDAADDWIAEAADASAVVVTADILLADRCLKAGATVLSNTGKPFTAASIGSAIATRAIMADLRAGGDQLGGPAPFRKEDRSRFLSALDAALVRLGRTRSTAMDTAPRTVVAHHTREGHRPMIKAILFDIDGTLIDSNSLHVEAWHRVFAEAGHAIERPAIASQIGKGGDNLVPALLPHLDETAQKALADGHGRVFKQDFLARAKPFPDARALLERAHSDDRQIVLASSASAEELEHYVDLLGIGGIVAASTSIDDVETSKPAPDIFAAALHKAGVPADQAVAVGDTPYDIASAGGAGIGTIALLSGGFAEAELTQAGAAAIYRDAADLLAQYDVSPLAR